MAFHSYLGSVSVLSGFLTFKCTLSVFPSVIVVKDEQEALNTTSVLMRLARLFDCKFVECFCAFNILAIRKLHLILLSV